MGRSEEMIVDWARRVAGFAAPALLLVFVGWTLTPFVILLHTALTGSGVSVSSSSLDLSLASFREVLNDPSVSFLRSLVLSTALSSAVCLASLVVGIPASYALARLEGKARSMIGGWILSTRFLPPIIPGIILFLVFRAFGILGTPIPLFLADLLVTLPFVIWVAHSFIADLPHYLDDMAFLDGLSRRRLLLSVIVPSLRAPLASVGAMAWLLVWNEYFFALIFSSSTRPVTVVIASWNTYQGVLWGPACAAAVLAIIPGLTLLLLSLRLLLRGFVFGARVNA